MLCCADACQIRPMPLVPLDPHIGLDNQDEVGRCIFTGLTHPLPPTKRRSNRLRPMTTPGSSITVSASLLQVLAAARHKRCRCSAVPCPCRHNTLDVHVHVMHTGPRVCEKQAIICSPLVLLRSVVVLSMPKPHMIQKSAGERS